MNNRNKPCTCGSGKKFKKCCGDPVMLLEKQREANRVWRENSRKESEAEEARIAAMPKLKPMRHNPLISALIISSAWRR